MKSFKGAPAVGLTCLLLGCGGRTIGSTLGGAAPGDGGAENPGDAGSPIQGSGPASGWASSPDGFAPGDEGEPPADLTKQPTVWIGETDTTVTYPGDPNPGDVVPPAGWALTMPPPERVVLILDVIGNTVAGTVTFGQDDPPAPPVDPTQPYPLEPTLMRANGHTDPISFPYWLVWPYPGFVYSLVSSELKGSLLTLAFMPAELWTAWCPLQHPDASQPPPTPLVCNCSAGSCRASGPTRQFDLLVSGNAMQGQLSSAGGGTPTSFMRLQRVQ
jgi:hypothetical protein